MSAPLVRQSSLLRREILVMVKMLLPLLFIIAVVAYFHEFVFEAIIANKAINGLIIIAASYGIGLILARLFAAQMDFYTIDRFGREAKEGGNMRERLDEPWLKKRYVRHYLGHIAFSGGKLSSQMEQSAIENELRALSTEYEHKLELPQFLVGFMIAMGLLGTFIGLLETLTGISGMLDGMGGGAGANMDEQFMKLVVELRKPLAGMGIAFSASMFGLVTSLMLAIMMINLRRYISRVVSHARNVMHDLTEITREGADGEAGDGKGSGGGTRRYVASIATGDMALQDIVYQAHDTSMMISNRIDGLGRKLETLFQLLENNIQASQKMTELLGFGPRMKETNENILAELKEFVGGQVEQHKLSQRAIDVATETARAVGGVIEAQRETQSNNIIISKEVTDRIGKVEESTIGLGRHLWDIKETFGKFASQSGAVDAISTAIGHHTLLLETLVKEDRNLQKRLVSIQQDLRDRTLPGPNGEPEDIENA